MKSLDIRSSSRRRNSSFLSDVSLLLTPPISYLVARGVCYQIVEVSALVFKSPLFYIVMALQCKSSDTDKLDMPQRSQKVLS